MLDGCENLKRTDVSNTYLLSRGTVVYVNAAGLLPMFTIYTAGGGRPGTGESITTTFDVFVESATLTGTQRIKDE
jgi:hypothetical protein